MDGSNAPATSNVFYKAPAGAANLSLTGAPIAITRGLVDLLASGPRRGFHSLATMRFNVWMGLLGGGDAAKSAALRKEF